MNARQRIIEGGIALMAKQGIRKTTMDNLASYLVMSKRTIYENFEDKVDIVRSIVKHIIEKSEENTKKIEEQSSDTIEGLFMMLNQVETEFTSQRHINNDVRQHYPQIFEEELLKHYNKVYQNIVTGLQRGIAQGDILGDTNLGFAVFAMLETVGMLMQNSERMVTITQVSPTEAFRYVLINFFRGIATEQGIAKIDAIVRSKK